MNPTSKKTKPPLFLIAATILIVAGLADIKYRGLFFRLLPKSVQSLLVRMIK